MIKSFVFTIVLIFSIFLFTSCTNKEKSLILSADLSEHALYSTYNFGSTKKIIDVGIQPLSLPEGIIGELFAHDAVLLDALSELGYELRIHPFYNSSDSTNFLQSGDLEVVTGGDLPAIMASLNMDVVITSLVKYGFSSIIAKEMMLIPDLKNKKIAYSPLSSAHFSLLDIIQGAGLREKDVTLIPMQLIEMGEALENGLIDAFIADEPNTSLVLAGYDDSLVLCRSLNSSYLYFAESFVKTQPEIIRLILASQNRSMGWLRSSEINLKSALCWMGKSGEKIGCEGDLVDINHWYDIVKNDLLDVSAAGALPKYELEKNGRINYEFKSLKALGKIAGDADWKKIEESFDPSFLNEVLKKSNYYSLKIYRFSENPSVNNKMSVSP